MEFLNSFNDEKAQISFEPEEVAKNKGLIMVGYILPFLFFIIWISGNKGNYSKFHANNQLAWFIAEIILGIVSRIVGIIPLLGGIFGSVLSLAAIVFSILLAIEASNGRAIRIPVIGYNLNVF